MDNSLKGAINKSNGAIFEQLISYSCKRYEQQRIAIIEKTPEPMKVIKVLGGGKFIACFEKTAQPDFKGVSSEGEAILFEAKHTDTDKMDYSRVTDEQLNQLILFDQMNAEVFILLSFQMKHFYRIPVNVWKNMKDLYGRKHLKESDIQEYRVNSSGMFIDFLRRTYYGPIHKGNT